MTNPRQQIADFVRSLKEDAVLQMNESQVRHTVIDPILKLLGWDVTVVQVEAPTGRLYTTGYADYVLRHPSTGKACATLEAKRPSVPLHLPSECPHGVRRECEKSISQALNYSLRLGAEITVLTNGLQWLFFETFRPGLDVFERPSLFFGSPADVASGIDEFLILSRVVMEQGDTARFLENREKSPAAGHFCYLNEEGVDQLCVEHKVLTESEAPYAKRVTSLLRALQKEGQLLYSLDEPRDGLVYVAGRFKLVDDDEQYLGFRSTFPDDSVRMDMRKSKGTLWPYPSKVGKLAHLGIAMRAGVNFRVFGEWYSESYLRPHAVSVIGANLGRGCNKLG